MVDIYTHSKSLFTTEFWKAVARAALRKYSCPQAVRDSLLRGLKAHGIGTRLNPWKGTSDTVIVLSGVRALQEQIARKRAGKVARLIAGPNIVVTPNDARGILLNPEIDYVLVPSQWVADYYESVAPSLKSKLVIWPAGVARASASTRDGCVILYFKSQNTHLYEEARAAIEKTGNTECTLTYGKYAHASYLEALHTAKAVIYISQSESQGLALQEAWMRDVPTFVHYTGKAQTRAFTWQNDKINAPYLTEGLGAFYRTAQELESLLRQADAYHPQPYTKKMLSDDASAAHILPLLK
jgi:hypothetical protein